MQRIQAGILAVLLTIAGITWLVRVGVLETQSAIVASFFIVLAALIAMFSVAQVTMSHWLFMKSGLTKENSFVPLFLPLAAAPVALWFSSTFLLYFVTLFSICLVVTTILKSLWSELNEQNRNIYLVIVPLTTLHVSATILFFQVNLVHDAFQYYAYLRSLVIDGDFNIYNELFHYNSDRFYNPYPHYSVRYLGTSLSLLPFFLAGHATAWLSNAVSSGNGWIMDGYSLPYTLAVSTGSSLYGLGAVMLIIRLCMKYFSREASFIAGLAIWFASPLLFFMYQWHGWAHTPSVFAVSLFLLISRRALSSSYQSSQHWFLIGALLGWMIILRPPNALFATVLLWDGICHLLARRKIIFQTIIRLLQEASSCFAGLLAVVSLQLIAWKMTGGSYFAAPYREVGDYFNWLEPQLWEILFSVSRHGLFVWSPVIPLSLIGLFLLNRFKRGEGWLALVLFLEQLYLFSCWSIWWTGIGFSNRFFINCLPLFGLGLAAMTDCLRRRSMVWLLTAIIVLLSLINICWIAAYRTDTIPMGIASPNRIVKIEPTAIDYYRIALNKMPDKLNTLGKPFWINENFYWFRFAHFFHYGTVKNFLSLLFVLIVTGGLAFKLMSNCLFRNIMVVPQQRRKKFPLLIILMTLLFSMIWIVNAGTDYFPYSHIHRLPGDFLTIASPNEKELFCSFKLPVTHIDIVSYLVYGNSLEKGEEAALIEVRDLCDKLYVLPLRAGIETAECSINRPEFRNEIHHDIKETKVVHRFLLTAYSSYIYTGFGYLATLVFSEPVRVKSVMIRYRSTTGTIVVSDIILSNRHRQ